LLTPTNGFVAVVLLLVFLGAAVVVFLHGGR
jgi:hypothetical protein